jgi:hypothetical protein
MQPTCIYVHAYVKHTQDPTVQRSVTITISASRFVAFTIYDPVLDDAKCNQSTTNSYGKSNNKWWQVVRTRSFVEGGKTWGLVRARSFLARVNNT